MCLSVNQSSLHLEQTNEVEEESVCSYVGLSSLTAHPIHPLTHSPTDQILLCAYPFFSTAFTLSLLFPPRDGYIFARSDGPYLGTVYKKVRYHQYTDGSFTTKIARSQQDKYLGILGPVIAAEVYDTIRVMFKNNASRPYSIHAPVNGL